MGRETLSWKSRACTWGHGGGQDSDLTHCAQCGPTPVRSTARASRLRAAVPTWECDPVDLTRSEKPRSENTLTPRTPHRVRGGTDLKHVDLQWFPRCPLLWSGRVNPGLLQGQLVTKGGN